MRLRSSAILLAPRCWRRARPLRPQVGPLESALRQARAEQAAAEARNG